MAMFDAFLKLDGIKGESVDSKHKDEIQLESWSWGMTNAGTGQYGSGSGAGKVQVQDVQLVKKVDSSSPILIKSCTKGDHIKTGVLTVRKAGGDQLEYFTVELTEILVSGISEHTDPSSPILMEHVSLNFRTFKVTYTPQTDKGAAGASVDFGYNLAEGKVL